MAMEASGVDSQTCEACARQLPETFYCESCDAVFCDTCWETQIPHRKGKKGLTGVAHEKANFTIAKRLENILTPTSDPLKQQQLHQDDVETAWFGVVREGHSSKPGLHDYGRYQFLMQASFSGSFAERWPQLVSFIGQTGDGKSTLIKMLIDQQQGSIDPKDGPFPTPVVGAVDSSNPTSGDVHLYADPRTFNEQFPILFADSEGLKGGEKVPLGDRTKAALHHQHLEGGWRDGNSATENRPRTRLLRKAWDIQWADDPSTRRREYTVRHLYPRFLYTFSDVVVYVLRNERTFEAAALSHLLQWAAKSIEGSINQPALPHAIIALNATDHVLPDSDWDVENATKKLLSGLDSTLEKNPTLSKYIDFWRQSGRIIKNAEDLVRCYYSSFRVVRIPAKGRYMLIDSQIHKLRNEIDKCCKKSHKSKIRRRLDLNADELAETLLSGFDHFSNNLERPFDFIELSWNLNPIPQGFAGNILRLALNIKENCPEMNGPQIFSSLSNMVASCIMLDYVRHRIKGTAEQLLKHYKPSLDQVLKEFCNSYWPCSYSLLNRSSTRQCVNTYRGHSKGHQDASGKVFGTGLYQSDFSADEYLDDWHNLLNSALNQIRRQMERASLQKTGSQESQVASLFHMERMNNFYGGFKDIDQFSSHSACFCCLRELPEYPLPCGHTICLPCVKAFGIQQSSTSWFLDHCPLHSKDRWGFHAEFKVKPHMAGVRVLSLDGGGMRGIVELQILAAIERHLGGIPIQDFFDLIVGTSAGGIVALGLGVKQWSVQECIRRFKTVSQKAFTPREFHGLAVLGHLAMIHHQAKYKTRPLEEGLEESFGQETLFGGSPHKPRSTKKVAVVSTTEAGQGPLIIANYNRPQAEKIPYRFERPERKDAEFKVWEAARATSAAPPFFKAFQRANSQKAYLDGALYFNCPIQVADTERKLLFPDVEDRPPDFVLSIGTGRNQRAMDREKLRRKGTQSSGSDGSSVIAERKRVMGLKLPRFLQVLKDRAADILDSQLAWDQFLWHAPGDFRRYVRMNPDIPDLPALDEVGKMGWLEEHVKQLLARPQAADTISQTVRCLFASCFYFEKSYAPTLDNKCSGYIRCRFQDEPGHVKKVAEYLERCSFKPFRPFFTVNEGQAQGDRKQIIPLPDDVFHGMKKYGIFELPGIEVSCSGAHSVAMITFCFNRGGEQYPISGFPRNLMAEDALFTSRENDRQAALRNMRIRSFASRDVTPRSSIITASQNSMQDGASGSIGLESGRSTPDAEEPRASMDSGVSSLSTEAPTSNESHGQPDSTRFSMLGNSQGTLAPISEFENSTEAKPRRAPGRSTWSNAPSTSGPFSMVSDSWRYSQDSLFQQQFGEFQVRDAVLRSPRQRESTWSTARPDSCTIPRSPPQPSLPRMDSIPSLSKPRTPPRIPQLSRSSTVPQVSPVSPVGSMAIPSQPSSVSTHSRMNSGASSITSWGLVPQGYTPPQPPPPPSPDTDDESGDVVLTKDEVGRLSIRYTKPAEPGWF